MFLSREEGKRLIVKDPFLLISIFVLKCIFWLFLRSNSLMKWVNHIFTPNQHHLKYVKLFMKVKQGMIYVKKNHIAYQINF